MPLFHMAGSGWAFAGLWQGATTVVLRDVDPGAILDALARHRVTNMLLVPAVIQFLLDTDGHRARRPVRLRVIVYGASPISDDVLIRGIDRFGGVFAQVYGMTETTGSITQLDGPDHLPELLRSCGKPYPWVQLRVVGDDGADAAPGTVGEVWTRSRAEHARLLEQPRRDGGHADRRRLAQEPATRGTSTPTATCTCTTGSRT